MYRRTEGQVGGGKREVREEKIRRERERGRRGSTDTV